MNNPDFAELKEKLDYYLWRIKILICYFKHDWKVSYTRIRMDESYSGKLECVRCYKEKYFSSETNTRLQKLREGR
jgi:hypothetical protein